MKKIISIIIIGIIIICSSCASTTYNSDEHIHSENYEAEYYALLVAVGEYKNDPSQNLPSMLIEVENLKNTLKLSDNWQEENIKVIKGANATKKNIFNGFKWLDEKENEDDICLIFFATHGGSIAYDFPPFDEADKMDEILATYHGFLDFPYNFLYGSITDDRINYFLNRLESKAICLIVDSCHSGGFNDNYRLFGKMNAEDFSKGFTTDMQKQNRVIMTSSREDELTAESTFTPYIIKSMNPKSDKDNNDFCSAEELFAYAEPIIRNLFTQYDMHPQIFDGIPGELSIIEPIYPSIPNIFAEKTGKTNCSHQLELSSEHPTDGQIKYWIDWGDGNSEYTEYFPSNKKINISNSWEKDGIYDVSVMSVDENGLESGLNKTTLIISDLKVDQSQMIYSGQSYSFNDSRWLAQSFIPSIENLSKVDIWINARDISLDMELVIREDLNGDDLAVSKPIIIEKKGYYWISNYFNEISLIPGEEYFILCRSSTASKNDWCACKNELNDYYKPGSFYRSNDGGNDWIKYDDEGDFFVDGAFVTYG